MYIKKSPGLELHIEIWLLLYIIYVFKIHRVYE